jgi:O-antigen ligase
MTRTAESSVPLRASSGRTRAEDRAPEDRPGLQSAETAPGDWQALVPLLLVLAFLFLLESIVAGSPDDLLAAQRGGDKLRQLFFGSCYLLAGAQLFRRPGSALERFAGSGAVVVLFAYALTSTLWSSVPAVTLKRAIHFGGMLLVVACALDASRPAERTVLALRVILPAGLVASGLVALFAPDLGREELSGAWKGIYDHKNTLGEIALFAVLAWAPALFETVSRRKQRLAAAVIVLAVLLAWQSDSKTSQSLMLASLAFAAYLAFPAPADLKIAAAVLPLVALLFWYFNFWGSGFASLFEETSSRDLTLTGRTHLWGDVLGNVWRHPIFGEGYNAFWTAGNSRAERLVASLGWEPIQAHNGYLDVLNDLGIVGAVIFLRVIFQSVSRVLGAALRGVEAGRVFGLFLAVILALNLSETSFCRGTHRLWFLFLTVTLLSGAAREKSV